MIKGIFFDLGGTLVSYKNVDRVIKRILSESKKKKETSFSVEELYLFYKKASVDVASLFLNKKFYLHKDLFREIFKKYNEYVGITCDPSFLNWFTSRHENLLIESFYLIKNAKKTLLNLKQKNMIVGIVSNIDSHMLNKIILNTQLNTMIDFKISSEFAQSCKPDRRIFELAREKAKLDSSELLFIGDSIEHDIIGSKNFGIKNVLFCEKNMRAPLQSGNHKEKPNYKIQDLLELGPLIDNLNRK